MAEEPQDMTSIVAVLSHQMGNLQHAVEHSTSEFSRRLTAVETWQIRADERAKGEDKLRQALRDERESREQDDASRVTMRFSRWQLWLGVVTGLIFLATGVIAAIQAFS